MWIEKSKDEFDMISFRFTGKELDEETNLYYMSARYFAPKTGVWISADPAGRELINPNRQGFSIVESTNWYNYCSNNPVRFNDPTGMNQNDEVEPTPTARPTPGPMWTPPPEVIGTKTDVDENILKVAEKHLNEPYVYPKGSGSKNKAFPNATVENGYAQNDCDIWTETVLKEAGNLWPKEFGEAKPTTVQTRIKTLNKAGKLKTTPSEGWNVIMLTDTRRDEEEGHQGLVYVNADGTMTLYQQGHHKWESNKQPNYNPKTDGTTPYYFDTAYYYPIGAK